MAVTIFRGVVAFVVALAAIAALVSACVGEDPPLGSGDERSDAGGPGNGRDATGNEERDGASSGNDGDVPTRDDADVGPVDAGPFYIFVTSGRFNGNLGGLAGADEHCAREAAALGFPGKYIAWLSTSEVDAINRIPDVGPWRRHQDNQIVIGSRAQLIGTEPGQGGVTNSVALGGSDVVWTGTDHAGRAVYTEFEAGTKTYLTCLDWTSSVSTATDSNVYSYGGEAAASGAKWNYGHSLGCNDSHPLYCLRQQ